MRWRETCTSPPTSENLWEFDQGCRNNSLDHPSRQATPSGQRSSFGSIARSKSAGSSLLRWLTTKFVPFGMSRAHMSGGIAKSEFWIGLRGSPRFFADVQNFPKTRNYGSVNDENFPPQRGPPTWGNRTLIHFVWDLRARRFFGWKAESQKVNWFVRRSKCDYSPSLRNNIRHEKLYKPIKHTCGP